MLPRPWISSLLSLLFFMDVSAFAQGRQTADPLDWPYWRGPEMNGISREKGLPDTWTPDGENLIWKNSELGTRSTPIVMNGKLYTMVRHNPATKEEAEKVVCVDAATGVKKWESVFNVFLSSLSLFVFSLVRFDQLSIILRLVLNRPFRHITLHLCLWHLTFTQLR